MPEYSQHVYINRHNLKLPPIALMQQSKPLHFGCMFTPRHVFPIQVTSQPRIELFGFESTYYGGTTIPGKGMLHFRCNIQCFNPLRKQRRFDFTEGICLLYISVRLHMWHIFRCCHAVSDFRLWKFCKHNTIKVALLSPLNTMNHYRIYSVEIFV